MKINIMLLLGSLLSITVAQAAQTITVNPDEIHPVTVASNEITPIRIIDDRIKHIRGTPGAFATAIDNGGSLLDSDSGIFLLKPSYQFKDKAFSLILTTENNVSYTLRITPEDKPATSLNLVSQASNAQQALRWEQASPYVSTLSSLLKHLVNRQIPAGFTVQMVKKLQPIQLTTHTWATLLQIIDGKQLRIEIYQLSHHNEDKVHLHPQLLHTPDILAVMLDQKTLTGFNQTYAYKVMRHDG